MRKKEKIGFIIFWEGKNGWYSQFPNPLKKTYTIRRKLTAVNYQEALEEALALNHDLLEKRQILPSFRVVKKQDQTLVRDVIVEAINQSNALEKTKRNYRLYADQFIQFLDQKCSQFIPWASLTSEVISMYISHLRGEEKSFETAKGYLHPIRLGVRMMMRRDETQKDLFQYIRLDGRGFKQPKTRSVIELSKVLEFAHWFEKKGRWQQALCVKLCGLCGLRVLEAQHLRWIDVDLDHGVICITATQAHTPKSASGYRTIPVCGEILRSLKACQIRPDAMANDSIFGKEDLRFWAQKQHQNSIEVVLPQRFTLKSLRKSFVTAVRSKNIDRSVVEAYIGHAPSNTMDGHYDIKSVDRLRVVSKAVDEILERGAEKEANES